VPEADVPDLLQDVLIAALDGIAEGKFCPDPLDPPRIMLRVWMLAIARNLAYTFRHTARFRHEKLVYVADFPAHAAVRPHPGDALAARSALQMLDRLPSAERELLSDLAAGWTSKEIAARDGVAQSTIWGRTTRARAKLRALIERKRGG
jgi:DNA-directed RNA polymerase specialized sigma24 family protein